MTMTVEIPMVGGPLAGATWTVNVTPQWQLVIDAIDGKRGMFEGGGNYFAAGLHGKLVFLWFPANG